jgi:hypothetical protein
MYLYRIKLIAGMTAASALLWFANAQAQTGSPADSAPVTPPIPSMTGALYQGLPGVWINQGKHLWFCQWQGNAAPRNERISCFGTELPPTPSR